MRKLRHGEVKNLARVTWIVLELEFDPIRLDSKVHDAILLFPLPESLWGRSRCQVHEKVRLAFDTCQPPCSGTAQYSPEQLLGLCSLDSTPAPPLAPVSTTRMYKILGKGLIFLNSRRGTIRTLYAQGLLHAGAGKVLEEYPDPSKCITSIGFYYKTSSCSQLWVRRIGEMIYPPSSPWSPQHNTAWSLCAHEKQVDLNVCTTWDTLGLVTSSWFKKFMGPLHWWSPFQAICSHNLLQWNRCIWWVQVGGGQGGEAWDGVPLNIFFSSDMEGLRDSSLHSFIQPRLGMSMSVYFLERGKAAHLITLSFLQLSESRDSSVMRAWNTPEARPCSLKLSLSSLPLLSAVSFNLNVQISLQRSPALIHTHCLSLQS